MELQEILKDLPEDKQNAILEAHKSAVEQERNTGISASRKKGDEVKKYMTEVNRFKDTFREHLDLDLSTSDDPFGMIAEKLKGFKTQTVNNNEYTAKVSRMENVIAEMQAENTATKQKLNTVKITDALNQVMGDSFHAKDFVIKNMIASGEVRLLDDGGIIFVDGDDELDLQKGIEKLKKNRPDLVKNISKAGSESSRREYKSNEKTMSLADFNALPWKERAAKMAEGYKLI